MFMMMFSLQEVNKAVDEFTTSSEMAMASIILVFIGSHGNQSN